MLRYTYPKTFCIALACVVLFLWTCGAALAVGTDGPGASGQKDTSKKSDEIAQKSTTREEDEAREKSALDKMLEKIHWLGHASFRVDSDKVVYFDPFELKKDVKSGDVIFITHEHADHCSPADVKKIVKKGTVIVTTADCRKKLSEKGVKVGTLVTVTCGDTLNVEGLKVVVVPAYNIDKKFHPKSKGWVGFVVNLDGLSIYHAGDTDFIPEMKDIDTDVALLPVSGTYVMTAEEAVEAAKAIGPSVAVPMHYGRIVGSEEDARTFKKKCPVPVRILERE